MGFAVMPEPVKPGIYLVKYAFQLVIVQNVCAWWYLELIYKKGQKKPKRINASFVPLYCDYIGEF